MNEDAVHVLGLCRCVGLCVIRVYVGVKCVVECVKAEECTWLYLKS